MIYVYYILMLLCFIISIFHLQYKEVHLIAALLILSIITEITVECIGKTNNDFYVVYHFFVPTEYAFITLIVRQYIYNVPLRAVMLFSIAGFVFISAYISSQIIALTDYPTIHVSIESFLIIIWCIAGYFAIKPNYKISIFEQPSFWIITAFFVYIAGTLCINSIYNILLKNDYLYAKELHKIFNSIFNYILYILLIIGISCYRKKQYQL